MQWLNLASNLLNYAPVRLGAIARISYHVRIDRLSVLQITAWFGMILYILALGIGSCVLATLIRPQIDWFWGALIVGQMILGGLLTRVFAGYPFIIKHGRGVDRLLSEHKPLWGAMIFRLADIGAFTGRMAAALMILKIALPASDIIILALVAFMANLIPFGRIGFREFAVVYTAKWLSSHGADVASQLPWEQLALVESMGEAVIFIPGGIFGIIWFKKRWDKSKRPASSDAP